MFRAQVLCASLALSLVGVVCIAFPRQGIAQSSPVSLTGVVKSAAGERMEGVTVSAREQGKTFTTSVFTDKDGEYFFSPLDAGSYKVWAQARGYEAGRAAVVINGPVQHQDFVLKETKDVTPQLTGDQWIASLPEQAAEDRRMKAVFRTECVVCHTPAFPLQNRFDEKGWEKIITVMSDISVNADLKDTETAPNAILNYYKPRLAAYLAKVRGPESSSMVIKLRPRPAGDATLAVITEYDAPLHEGYVDHANGSDWSQGTPHARGHMHDAIEDLAGNIWFTDNSGEGRSFAKVDVNTGKVTPFSIPGPARRPGALPSTHGTTRDQKGFIWDTIESSWASVAYWSSSPASNLTGSRPGGLVRIDPQTDKFEVFTPESGTGVYGWIRPDGQGRIWANEASGIIMLDPETKKFTSFKSPYDLYSPDGITLGYGATGDSEGNGWWSQISIDVINKANADTGKVESIKLPPIRSEIAALFTGDDRKIFDLTGASVPKGVVSPWRQAPRRLTADLHGDTVWVPMFYGNTITSINIHTKAMKQYPLPTADSNPYELVVDDNHMVWAALQNADIVAKLDPSTGKWTEYNLPTLGTEIRDVSVVNIGGKTEVNVAEGRAGKVARLQFRTKEEEQTLKNEVKKVAQARQGVLELIQN